MAERNTNKDRYSPLGLFYIFKKRGKKMKRFFATVLAMVLMLTTFSLTAAAAGTDETAEVYVTICDKNGQLVLVQEKIIVTDVDEDNALTINDALYNAHEAKYEGGAAAGYGSYYNPYLGLAMNKLWGVVNGERYGYYVNNALAWNLADTVKDGDYINAFVYTDLTNCSDIYCYFDVNTVSVSQGDEVTLTLSMIGFDVNNNYNLITPPVAGAAITVNGRTTEYKTDSEGKATVKLNEAGTYVISAVSETQLLVPPVCVASVEATTEITSEAAASDTETAAIAAVETMGASGSASPETGDSLNAAFFAILMMISFTGIVVFTVKGRRSYEK